MGAEVPESDEQPDAPQAPTASKKRWEPSGKEAALTDFDLFNSYQVHFGERVKQPVTKTDVEDILLGCGILDPVISTFLFNAMVAMDNKKKKKENKENKAKSKVRSTYAKPDDVPASASYSSFLTLCHTFKKGEDKAKWEIMFNFMDGERSGSCDKNGCSIAVRHLLWCQTNWHGEEVLYDGPHDLDLYFNVPTEAIAQLKANKFAHEMVTACHGGGRSLQMSKKQFVQFMMTGGKNVEVLKGLFSVFGAYPPPDLNKEDYDE